MNILIITFGSHGDVQPYVALGKGLKSVGHTVTICTSCRFESFITDHGLDYGYMTDELLKLLDTDVGREAIENTVGLFGALKTMIKLVKLTKPINRQMIIDSWEAAQVAEPDLVIYHPKALGGVSIAEKLGVPVIMANLQPMIVPTAEFPVAGLPDLNLGRWYNRFTYHLIQMGYRTYMKTINEIRQNRLGLGPLPKSAGIMHTAEGKLIPIVHGYSSYVVPRPTDWPDQATVNGYWFLDQLDDWQPTSELRAFLDEGEAPIYVGFGSMAGRNPQRLANIVIDALQQANVRGIIATGWGGLKTSHWPDTILKIDQAPHEWLFPRMSAVMHHGGAGTTAAGLRAGRPTIVCPFMGDQPFWGKRVYHLGVGPKPMPQKKLSVDKLANALHTVNNDIVMREKAAALGEQIRREKSIANTIAVIEDLFTLF